MPALYSHTTRANGTVLTATIYNGDHQNHIDNGVPAQLDDYSVNVGQMQTQTSPGGVGTEAPATSLAGELERIRYVLAQIKGVTNWYDPGTQSNALVGIQIKTSTGTYTPTTGTRSVIVELVGGGGAGGGMPGGIGAGLAGAAPGGGAGGYARKRLTSGFSGVTVTIGAGGTGVSGGAGNNGVTTSFGAVFSATPGTGAVAGVGAAVPQVMFNGSGGGGGSGGDLNLTGGSGGDSYLFSTVSAAPGSGGASYFGAGGPGIGINGAPRSQAGISATNFGAGGSGGATASSGGSGANAGGNGAQGICIIYEYA